MYVEQTIALVHLVGLSRSDIDFRYLSDISKKKEYQIISDVILSLRFKHSNRKQSGTVRFLSKENEDVQGIQTLKTTLQNAVHRHFTQVEFEPLYTVATLLDPQYKV